MGYYGNQSFLCWQKKEFEGLGLPIVGPSVTSFIADTLPPFELTWVAFLSDGSVFAATLIATFRISLKLMSIRLAGNYPSSSKQLSNRRYKGNKTFSL